MKKTGAELAVYALEQIGVKFTFGIPGVHNTEIYDQINSSEQIEPVLVTHEGGASFMALGVSTTGDSIGTLLIVPAAGTTNAMSGIGEAFLDGLPMLVISGGTRRDTGKSYQLHQLDQQKLVQEITKDFVLIEKHEDIIPLIYKAFDTATSGEPGPVFIEIPVELQLFRGEISEMQPYQKKHTNPKFEIKKIKEATELLKKAKKPGIYVGWGAAEASEFTKKIADKLLAPVATTLQGKASFPANHPLHTGFGFGANATPTGQNAFKNCDVMLAVGVRFSEIGTGSFGAVVPENLIHIDINPEVFSKNYPAKIAIEADAKEALKALWLELEKFENSLPEKEKTLKKKIAKDKEAYFNEWLTKKNDELVSPGFFFKELAKQADDDAYIVVDDGKHTYLAAELMPINHSRHFISPTDFNCMGFCAPASIGVKFANPNNQVIGIVGDGAFMMTAMELLTANTYQKGVILFIFNDGELGQISQFQKIPLNRKTATILGNLQPKGIAMATGADFIEIKNDNEIAEKIKEAFEKSKSNNPVLVNVKMDYSKRTMMTKGVVKVNLSRFPLKEKIRFITRAMKRHLLG